MTRKVKIKGSVSDGYEINQTKVTNNVAFKEAKASNAYQVYKLNGKRVIRSKPDANKNNNVNKK